MIAPCKTCDKHGEDPKCHSYCEGYLEFYEWNEQVRKRRSDETCKYMIKENLAYFNRKKRSTTNE